MSKAKAPDQKPTGLNKAETWPVVRKEIATGLLSAIAQVRDQLEGEEDPKVLARSYRTAALILDVGIDLLSLPLFEMEGDRPLWDVYLEGTRGLLRDYRTSFLLSAIIPLFKLGEVGSKTASLDEEALKLLHSGQLVLKDLDTYVESRAFARSILQAFGKDEDGLLGKVYAVAKVWEDEEAFENFTRVFEQMLDQSMTVVIEGPIQLYLMLSKDEMTLIFKALSGRVADDREIGARQLASALALHEELQEKFRNSRIRECCMKIFRLGLKRYHQNWVAQHQEIR